MANLTLQALIALAEQLPPEEQLELGQHLIARAQQANPSAADKLAQLRAIQVNSPIQTAPSIRREEWYADDGR